MNYVLESQKNSKTVTWIQKQIDDMMDCNTVQLTNLYNIRTSPLEFLKLIYNKMYGSHLKKIKIKRFQHFCVYKIISPDKYGICNPMP